MCEFNPKRTLGTHNNSSVRAHIHKWQYPCQCQPNDIRIRMQTDTCSLSCGRTFVDGAEGRQNAVQAAFSVTPHARALAPFLVDSSDVQLVVTRLDRNDGWTCGKCVGRG